MPFLYVYVIVVKCTNLTNYITPTHLPRYLVGRQLVNYISQRVGEEEVMDDTNETEDIM